ncbi:MAG: DUF4402 domain-containing protein [Bacteroidales bacterium]|nr:DUF4402 domain-containing protein [Bacteroidales bacterium]
MKNIFKSLMIVVLFVGLGSSAFAQVSNNITTEAKVQTALIIDRTTDLNFGGVVNGTNPTLNASTGETPFCGTSAALGKFTVTAQAGVDVTVNFEDNDLKATVEGDVYTLSFEPSVYWTADNTATDGETEILSNGNYTTSGTDYFFVGGVLIVGDAAAAPAATYAGTFTMTVTYN